MISKTVRLNNEESVMLTFGLKGLYARGLVLPTEQRTFRNLFNKVKEKDEPTWENQAKKD